jgi:hypothetical protein
LDPVGGSRTGDAAGADYVVLLDSEGSGEEENGDVAEKGEVERSGKGEGRRSMSVGYPVEEISGVCVGIIELRKQ